MNTNLLKRFAQQARIKLIQQVTAKLQLVLSTDSAELREKAAPLKKLQEAINSSSREQVIDKVAYIWFNRLMALRFMDANDYQPIGVKVLTPKPGHTLPELLDEAKQGHIPEGLPVKTQHVYDLLDGKIPGSNPQNEAYKELLIGACNQLHQIFPFLFERISDYTELLLPDDLISEFSIVHDFQQGMSDEDCQEVEIIGWLYQFYISELNDKLISSKKKYDKQELAPASQLFTPKWVVQYMVDNTLGQLWTEINLDTKVTDSLEYYIKPAYKDQLKKREVKSIEDIKFFEPCVGSGHILSYAFDVFYKIYEEQGYNPNEIPELIITKNLYGVDIDPRAAQLASFVLFMKGRQKNRRFLRTVVKNKITPNITFYQDFDFDDKFNNASALGSLINVDSKEIEKINVDENSLFGGQQAELKKLYILLGQKYDVVVTNPPYIGSGRMENTLKQFVETNYPETKSDLFATFILRCLELCNEDGLTGYMTPFVWMFISSYEKLRTEIIDKHFINNLIQLEYSGFDGATVPICTFTLRNSPIENAKGSYIRLSDFKGAHNQAPKTLEAIQNPTCGWFFNANQKDFEKIPGSPIGYWLSEKEISAFLEFDSLSNITETRKGLATSDNNRFLRLWHEIAQNKGSYTILINKKAKWFPHNKGGARRKWFGNNEFFINWEGNGFEIKNFKDENGKLRSRPQNLSYSFKQAVTWSKITSGGFSSRLCEGGFLFDDAAAICYSEDLSLLHKVNCFLNSKISQNLLNAINPTLNIQIGDIGGLPVAIEGVNLDGENCIVISKTEWNSRETSWDFQKNELIRITSSGHSTPSHNIEIEEAFDLYVQYWQNKFYQLHKNEEELNKQFMEIYGLQEELTPDVPLSDITILKEELDQRQLAVISKQYISGWVLNGDKWELAEAKPKPSLPFDAVELMRQFISYAVGCMFGRYSLDKQGLILANQGETIADYNEKVYAATSHEPATNSPHSGGQRGAFYPDDDNIIPILDDEWFEDDIVSRFKAFLKISFGAANFDKNMAFIEECLGKDIRKYFTRDFYADHTKCYKKRPIYWMFSSPKGSFNVLIYMHRYTPDTLSLILNSYLKEYREKLNNRIESLNHLIETGTATEQTKAAKERDKLNVTLLELQEYERDILYPLATDRIAIDLDDGVLVNYNKFGKAIKPVAGLNDKKTKDKVKGFDWINVEEIR